MANANALQTTHAPNHPTMTIATIPETESKSEWMPSGQNGAINISPGLKTQSVNCGMK
jgi:hypothetical protein